MRSKFFDRLGGFVFIHGHRGPRSFLLCVRNGNAREINDTTGDDKRGGGRVYVRVALRSCVLWCSDEFESSLYGRGENKEKRCTWRRVNYN